MKRNFKPVFKKKIILKGPALFLIGPIGTFFPRLLNYLEKKKIKTYKVLFPLHEYGFPKSKLISFDRDIYEFKDFLKQIIIKKNIKHIFMYGNVLIPHKIALNLVDELSNEGKIVFTHIFELGYLRPNFVTLEEKGVNFESAFILKKDFYAKQEPYINFPKPVSPGLRVRKIWKAITFLNHSFKNYKIVDFEHKLQPKPSYVWFQLKGFFLKFYFQFSEYQIKRKCFHSNPFFIVILQVSSDSQIVKGSKIKDNYQFIQKVIQKFAEAKLDNFNLVFKHHPRDRGYINYSKFIKENSKKMHIQNQVFYIHDYFLSKIFKNNLCKGTVLINSSVGYQSLFHSVPVKAIGIAPYNIEELADQKDLKSFFKKPSEVNVLLFSKFYRYVLENSQINGNFDGFFPFDSVFEIQNK